MTGIILVFAAFFIMYFIAFLRQIKRKKENEFSSVEEFHKSYDRYQITNGNRESLYKYRRNNDNDYESNGNRDRRYTYRYVTKYNNLEDYREKT